MTLTADRMYDHRCEDCGDDVTVVDAPARHRADDPHWAEAYVERDANYQLCWKCGKVLWSPLDMDSAASS